MNDPLAETALRGKRIVLTRAKGETNALRASLENLGATVYDLPTIAVGPPDDVPSLDRALQKLGEYDWIAFASRHAVQAVFERLEALRLAGGFPQELKVAAVGDATAAEARQHGVEVECVPERASAAALASALVARGVRGARVLIPAGDLARRELPDDLRSAGAVVDEVIAYRIVPPVEVNQDTLSRLVDGGVDVVVLASPSAFHNLMSMLPAGAMPAESVRMACMGPTTASAVHAAGIHNPIVAEPSTVDGLVRAIVRAHSNGEDR